MSEQPAPRPIDRRRFLGVLAAAPAVAAVLQACSDDLGPADPPHADSTAGTDGTAGSGTRELRSTSPRDPADAGLAPPAAEAVNALGIDLYRRLAAERPTDNLVLSPVSISLALSMAAAGAAGPTLAEMLDVLHATEIDLHPAMNALSAALARRDREGVQLSIANATWLQDGMAVTPAFLDTLATQYGAGVETADFRTDAEQARDDVNAWVAARTRNRIPDLLPADVLTELTRFVLVNAVHLDADWAVPFVPERTRDAPFTTASGDTVDVPSMVREGELAHASGDGWQAVELPYAGDELAMLLFLPEPDFLPLFEEIFLVSDATSYLTTRPVRLVLPRWDTSSSFSLADQLGGLGMPTAFTDAADFSGITSDAALRIAHVIHRADITVGEEGTVAAAATAVVGEATSAPPAELVEVVFDRPFVFVLRDRTTGAVVFLGRVADPRG